MLTICDISIYAFFEQQYTSIVAICNIKITIFTVLFLNNSFCNMDFTAEVALCNHGERRQGGNQKFFRYEKHGGTRSRLQQENLYDKPG